jgi:hypothetical protein
MTSKKLEKIADAHNVDMQTGWEAGYPIIELWGRKEDLERLKDLIWDDYLIRGDERPAGPDGRDVLYLYSDKRIRWDKMGY